MCNEDVNNYAHAQEYVCNKGMNSFPSSIQVILKYYKAREMCDKAVYICYFVFISVPDWYNTQNMCDIEDTSLLKYCLDKYNTQKNV